jgi:hypothetical protein
MGPTALLYRCSMRFTLLHLHREVVSGAQGRCASTSCMSNHVICRSECLWAQLRAALGGREAILETLDEVRARFVCRTKSKRRLKLSRRGLYAAPSQSGG